MKNGEDGRTQCWTVEAYEARGDDAELETRCFRWVFVQREYAYHVYTMGQKELPQLRWSYTVTPFGNLANALDDIKYLKNFEATKGGSEMTESEPVNYFQEQEESWKGAMEDWQRVLWRVQLQEYPDSVRLTPSEAFRKWCGDEKGNINNNHTLALFAMSACYEGGVFYECGEGRKWHGYRYGTDGHEYLSGF